MRRENTVYLHVWTGDEADALAVVRARYSGCEVAVLVHREVRAGGWRGQIRLLRSLRGTALVYFFQSAGETVYRDLLLWTALFHHCGETVVADAGGQLEVYRRRDCWRRLPWALVCVLADAWALAASWLWLQLLSVLAQPQNAIAESSGLDVAYLYPFPVGNVTLPGGAMTHVKGVLSGLSKNSASCEVFSPVPLPSSEFLFHKVDARKRPYLFWETLVLSYNLRFVRKVSSRLRRARPGIVYQRHMAFTVAGAVLSRWLRVPLVLEYNGSTVWVAENWDPVRFGAWLRLCEEVSMKSASLIVVVSEALRDEVVGMGISPERILVNPNGVEPEVFAPRCGGQEVREQLGVRDNEVLVGFVGTFGPWHGVQVLEQAILQLLDEQATALRPAAPLKFLLVGEGLLFPAVKAKLQRFSASGEVMLPGLVAHELIPSYLDACDILVSPHTPMPGRPFFGSPTKLFEYMAMGKAIVASNLEQLAQVLTHRQSALLVEPENPRELAAAIALLACDRELRGWLGANARAAAVTRHSWRENVRRVLERIAAPDGQGTDVIAAMRGRPATTNRAS